MDEVQLARRREPFRWLASLCDGLCERLAGLELPEVRAPR
jgi:hypothetical protein